MRLSTPDVASSFRRLSEHEHEGKTSFVFFAASFDIFAADEEVSVEFKGGVNVGGGGVAVEKPPKLIGGGGGGGGGDVDVKRLAAPSFLSA